MQQRNGKINVGLSLTIKTLVYADDVSFIRHENRESAVSSEVTG